MYPQYLMCVYNLFPVMNGLKTYIPINYFKQNTFLIIYMICHETFLALFSIWIHFPYFRDSNFFTIAGSVMHNLTLIFTNIENLRKNLMNVCQENSQTDRTDFIGPFWLLCDPVSSKRSSK